METETAVATPEAAPAPPALDAKRLLARLNHRLAMLRAWLAHDHDDEPYWWSRETTVASAQYERFVLRQVANALHVERATTRGRIHGTRFATLDDQRAWLAKLEQRACANCARWARLPPDATLAKLREGKLPL